MDLHELIAGLDGAQDLYERGRPPYPPALVHELAGLCGIAPGAVVLDLGAGTGKLSRALLDAGFEVAAVEPLESMRSFLAAAIGPGRVQGGTAEAIPHDDRSFDAVLCGDSYHWFDPVRAPAEIHRVLRPGGALGLVWRWVDSAPGENAWTADLRRLLDSVRPDHPGFTDDRGSDALTRHGGFSPPVRSSIALEHRTSSDDLCAYVASLTFVALLERSQREQLLLRVAELVEDLPQPVRLPMLADIRTFRRL